MASEVVQIVLRAQDEATAKVRALSGELGGFARVATRLASSLGSIGSIVGSVATVTAAIVAVGKRFADSAEDLERLSNGAGVTTARFQALRQVVQEGGGSAEALSAGLKELNRSIATGDPLLKSLGINTRDTGEAFQQLVQALANTNDAAARTEVAQRLLGRSGVELAAQARELAENTQATEQALRRAGAIMSDVALRDATTRLLERARRVKDAARASGRETTTLPPAELERLWQEAKRRG